MQVHLEPAKHNLPVTGTSWNIAVVVHKATQPAGIRNNRRSTLQRCCRALWSVLWPMCLAADQRALKPLTLASTAMWVCSVCRPFSLVLRGSDALCQPNRAACNSRPPSSRMLALLQLPPFKIPRPPDCTGPSPPMLAAAGGGGRGASREHRQSSLPRTGRRALCTSRRFHLSEGSQKRASSPSLLGATLSATIGRRVHRCRSERVVRPRKEQKPGWERRVIWDVGAGRCCRDRLLLHFFAVVPSTLAYTNHDSTAPNA